MDNPRPTSDLDEQLKAGGFESLPDGTEVDLSRVEHTGDRLQALATFHAITERTRARRAAQVRQSLGLVSRAGQE